MHWLKNLDGSTIRLLNIGGKTPKPDALSAYDLKLLALQVFLRWPLIFDILYNTFKTNVVWFLQINHQCPEKEHLVLLIVENFMKYLNLSDHSYPSLLIHHWNTIIADQNFSSNVIIFIIQRRDVPDPAFGDQDRSASRKTFRSGSRRN